LKQLLGGFYRKSQQGGFGPQCQQGGFGPQCQQGGFGPQRQQGGFASQNQQGAVNFKRLHWLGMILLFFMAVTLVPALAAKNVVVIGMLGDNETLNPVVSENNTETWIINCIFSRLLRINPKLQIEPELAAKMPSVSSNGLNYTFRLRPGVKFHDGVEVTSADVKFLYEMKISPKNAVPSTEMWEKIKEFKIIDKYNFRITLKQPSAAWLENWCYTDCAIPPKHILEKEFKASGSLTKGGAFSRNPVGSGPYRFAEWKSDQYIMLKRNPDYFGKEQPRIETLVFKVVPDTNGLLAQFKKGEIDVYPNAQANQYRELMNMKKGGAKIRVFKKPAFTYMHADFNLRHPALREKAVRQALCYSFPKQKFIATVLDGVGTPAYSNIVPMSWAYNPNVKQYGYNPAKAKQLLDESGWKPGANGVREKNGVKLEFKISTNAGNKIREKFNEIAKQEWEAIGAKVEIRNYESSAFFGDILDNIKFDVAVFGWISAADPDCYTLWHSNQIPNENNGQGQNYVGYKNQRIDYLVSAGQTELNQAKRKRIYEEIQQILAEDVPYMFVYYYNNIDAVTAKLLNFKSNPTQADFTWNVAQWRLK
jgi:peptide/nickel transport system substrate-binding protein